MKNSVKTIPTRQIQEILIDLNISCDDKENSFVIFNKCDDKNKCYGATVGHGYGMFDVWVKKTRNGFQLGYRSPSKLYYDYEEDEENPEICEEFIVSTKQLVSIEEQLCVEMIYNILDGGNHNEWDV